MSELILSEKYKRFLRATAPVEFLEGTTAAGKTTVGAIKFLLRVAKNPKKQHIISGLDTGTIEKNILNKELGILDIFAGLLEYNPNGKGSESMPHLIYKTPTGPKIIYVLGYDNKARWKKALGGQYGCLYIDEINVADMEYVREASMRCDYLMATLNPDNPELPIYKEYINHARPLPEYANDGPPELLNMLSEPVKEGWVWWYFSFDHNAGLPEEKKQQIISNVPVGTKIYKNKILGLRGKTSGLVFNNFDRARHLISEEEAKKLIKTNKQQREYFIKFSAGLDTAYSSKSPDTIAMTYIGITNLGRCLLLEERIYNNSELSEPIAPSDTVVNYIAFLDRCRDKWGATRDAFVDSADQATITEFKKHKRNTGCVYMFNPAWKQMKIIDRITMQLGWFAKDQFLVVDTCQGYCRELESYCWKEDKDLEPEDANDHLINSAQYAWIPYTTRIGGNK
jgi:PBSX family phage terminase large subunit